MEILGTVVSSLFGSAIGGSGLGLIGAIAGKVFGWLELKEKAKVQQAENAHELALIQAQSQMRQAEMESELLISQVDADTKLRTAAYAHDSAMGTPHKWCSSVLRLVRPSITVFLLGLTTWIYWKAYAMGEIDTLQMLADEVVFMTSLAITFWFGSRGVSR